MVTLGGQGTELESKWLAGGTGGGPKTRTEVLEEAAAAVGEL